MKRVVVTIILIIFSSQKGYTSEAYSWYTINKASIEEHDGKMFLVNREYDPNGISLVQTDRRELNYPFSTEVEIVYTAPDRSYFLLCDSVAYYATEHMESNVVLLAQKNEVKRVIDDTFVLHCGDVHRFLYLTHDNKAKFATLNDFPSDFELLDKGRNSFLLKTKDKVLLYYRNPDRDSAIIKTLDVDPLTVVYRKGNEEVNFLYDDNSFYLIENLLHVHDLSDDFPLFNKHGGFLEWAYRPNGEYDEIVFEERALEALWVYSSIGYFVGDRTLRIFALPGRYVSTDQTIITHNDQYFRSGQDLYGYRMNHRTYFKEIKDPKELAKVEKRLAEYYAVDVKKVKHVDKLHAFSHLFADDELVYRYVYNSDRGDRFDVVENLSPQAVLYQGIGSFCNPTSWFFDDRGVIKFVGHEDKVISSIEHKGPIKTLGVAYIFDNKMLIEGKVIDSPLDFETATLHESSVDVINSFSDAHLPPLEVAYRHYFSDKNGTYLYKTGDDKLEKILNE